MQLRATRPFGILAALAILCVTALVAQAWSATAASGQTGTDSFELPESNVPSRVHGLAVNADLVFADWVNSVWVDPIRRFDLGSEPLAEVPSFNYWTLHSSTVFAPGVANLSVRNAPDLSLEIEQHNRALQAVATGELALATVGTDIEAANTAISARTQAISDNRAEIRETEDELSIALDQLADIASSDDDEVNAQTELNTNIDDLNGAIIELALQAFTGETSELEQIFEDPGSSEPIERRVITDQLRDFQRTDIETAERLIVESEQRREGLAEDRERIETVNATRLGRIETLNAEIDGFITDREDFREDIVKLRARGVELVATIAAAADFTKVTGARYQASYHQRLDSFVSGTDIPLVALNAYVRAARTLAQEDRSCGIHWSQLAGIGRVESIHGYFGDSTLDVNGSTTVDITGLPLDGRVLSGSTSGATPDPTGRTEERSGVKTLAEIFDTDGGLLDGDPVYDRAVGPMQFIPTTWALYTPDGNDDGESDPQNIYDAALAAARYLCDAPGSMLTHEGEQNAYFAYNHDIDYSWLVTRTGRSYHRQLSVAPESGAFAAFALTPTPEEQEKMRIAEARAAAKAKFIKDAEDEAVALATETCLAENPAPPASPDAATGAVDDAAPAALPSVDTEAAPAEGSDAVAAVPEAAVPEAAVPEVAVPDCNAIGESARAPAAALAAVAYIDPPEGEYPPEEPDTEDGTGEEGSADAAAGTEAEPPAE